MPHGFTFTLSKDSDDNSTKEVDITNDKELGSLLFSLHRSGYDDNTIMDTWNKLVNEVIELKRENKELKKVNERQKGILAGLYENLKDTPEFEALTDEFRSKMRHFMGISD